MSMDLSEFFEVFFEEAEELLADMEKLLLALDMASPDLEELNAIFRAAHSIKGGASTFGMPEITEVTHVLESLLDKIRKGELALTREHVDVFLQSQDVLRSMIEARRGGTTADAQAASEVMATLTVLAQAANGAPAVATTVVPIDAASVDNAPVEAVSVDATRDEPVRVNPAESAKPQPARETGEAQSAPPSADSNDLVAKAIADNTFGLFQPLPAAAAATAAAAAPAAIASVPQTESSPVATQPIDETTAAAVSVAAVADNASPANAVAPTVAPAAASDAQVNARASGNASSVAPDVRPAIAQSADPKSPKAPAKEGEKPRSAESSTIRVGVEKVDELINMVGELVITHAMIEQLSTELDPVLHQRLLNSVAQLARNTRELQESVLGIRMLPMDIVFSRFPRLVRDLAAKLGKKIELITVGAATELDKSLTERLVDPLTHLVRNSIDHGIEMPDIRTAAGKSETGRLTLSAAHQGGSIVIEVSDDGGGLHRDRILAKARQQGLPVSDTMPDDEVWQLIFAPGFSTAEKVTDVSGRGVGMDVVKRNITSMGGSVEIRSAKGFGSNIRIALPLTLAILDGMSVKVGNEIYILGLSSVVESLQPTATAIKDVMGQGSVIKMRDEYLPIIPLYKVFGVTPKFTEPSKSIIVILEAEGRKVGLMVDELVGQQQVVVKSLETNYRRVTGISGATILGDGSVALILDVPTLIRQSRQSASSASEPAIA